MSGLEMAQNSQRMQWTREEVDAKLYAIMHNIYAKAKTASKEYDTSLASGANIAGFERVAEAMLSQGVL